MRRALTVVAVVLALAVLGGGAVAAKLYADVTSFRDTPFGNADEKVVEIPAGAGPRQIVRLLARSGVLADEQLAWRYVHYLKRDRRPMRAGEYAFAGALRPDDVLERIYRGEVRTYRFTVPEGLRMEEIAAIVEEAGLGRASELVALMRDPAFARELGVPGQNLEGYLFPDTYTFTRNPKARAVLSAMVERFKAEWARADAQRLAGVDLDERRAVTLASIVEKETGRPDERPRISCVFHNRLKRGMRLQTDPTVMYATMLRRGGAWSQNISKADLMAEHPYNTYTVAGLPPGPIANPGGAALAAALHPAECKDLYFVSRNDGSHVFCPDLACHNAAVQHWQVEFFRHRRAAAAHPRTPPGTAPPRGAPRG
jgi:peptidoglycan lytic transglycosylase G